MHCRLCVHRAITDLHVQAATSKLTICRLTTTPSDNDVQRPAVLHNMRQLAASSQQIQDASNRLRPLRDLDNQYA